MRISDWSSDVCSSVLHGPILPLGSNVVALTPIAAFRPRRWRGAVLQAETEIRFHVLDPYKRPVSATADSHEVRDVVAVMIRESRDRTVTLLFQPEHNLEERMLAGQFPRRAAQPFNFILPSAVLPALRVVGRYSRLNPVPQWCR